MSTRCQVQVIGQEFPTDQEDRLTLYHHSDGYPSHMLPEIAKAYEIGSGPPAWAAAYPEEDRARYANAELWRLGRTNQVASFLCAADPGTMEPLPYHDLHGDIEWLYRIHLSGGYTMSAKPGWEVEVFKVLGGNEGDEETRLHRVGRWPLATAVARQARIEKRGDSLLDAYYKQRDRAAAVR